MYRKGTGFETLGYPQEVKPLLEREACLLWVDAEDPSPEELQWVQAQFHVHPIAMEDYNSPQERSRIDRYREMYSIVVFALGFAGDALTLVDRPLTLFVGTNYLVTLHVQPFPEIREAMELWERNIEEMECEIGVALYALLDVLIDDYFPLIDQLSDAVESIEDHVLKEGRPADLDKIFHLKRQLIYLRRAVAPERDVLNVLLRRELPLFSEGMMIYFQDLYDHVVRVLDSLDTHRDLLSGALDLYVSVSSNRLSNAANRLNITMQTLTAWSIILMTASLIAGIYGMNFKYMPELDWRWGYAGALGAMFTLGGGLILYFKRRHWL
ncbi:MAG: magnesium/cobalt transporter CorA [Armatimonadetes bacterium]|nr:magnesium/cobalt transporter CorA [Armatimonadota bacterium]